METVFKNDKAVKTIETEINKSGEASNPKETSSDEIIFSESDTESDTECRTPIKRTRTRHMWTKEETRIIKKTFDSYIKGNDISPKPSTKNFRRLLQDNVFPSLADESTPRKMRLLFTKVYNTKRLKMTSKLSTDV